MSVIAALPIDRFVKLPKIELAALAAFEQGSVAVAAFDEGLKGFKTLGVQRYNERLFVARARTASEGVKSARFGPSVQDQAWLPAHHANLGVAGTRTQRRDKRPL